MHSLGKPIGHKIRTKTEVRLPITVLAKRPSPRPSQSNSRARVKSTTPAKDAALIDVVLAERATMPLVDLQILVGAPMTTIQSSLLWGDPGVDVERSFARVSYLARRVGVREANANLEFDDQPP